MANSIHDLMPRIMLGSYAISRLIVGGNPFSGNSHVSPALDQEMRDYHTSQRILQTLRLAEKWGINAFQSRGDNHMMRLINDYRVSGGRLHWIAQTASERRDLAANVRQIAHAGAVAIYHHGTRTDNLWKAGQIDNALDTLKSIRDTGLLVGLGTHLPEVIIHAEEHDWDVDFYMASFYNPRRANRDNPRPAHASKPEEVFVDSDRDTMCNVIRQTDKTVLAFKVLAGGRLAKGPAGVRSALAYAFANIKPTDAVVVGIFNKYRNQVAENALLAIEFGSTRTQAAHNSVSDST